MVYFVSTDKSRSRRPRRRNAEINITNLMDVMMVLLVVFMVAAPLMTSGIALNLPKVGGQNLTGKETSLNISVDSDGFYYIGKEEIPAEKIVAKVMAVRSVPLPTQRRNKPRLRGETVCVQGSTRALP